MDVILPLKGDAKKKQLESVVHFFQLLFLPTQGAAAAAAGGSAPVAPGQDKLGPVTPFRNFEELLSRFEFMEKEGVAG